MNFRKRMLSALSPMSGFGASDQMPSYVGVRVGPDGAAYYRVLDDAATAVAGYLNQYRLVGEATTGPAGAVFSGQRAEGGGNLAATVAPASSVHGIAIRGDVTKDAKIDLYVGDRLDFVRANGFYILNDPPAGWQVGRTGDVVLGELKQAVVAYRAGSVVGGALVLTGLWWLGKRRE